MTREQQIKIQRCIDEFYSNRPQVRDELGAALQVLYEAEPKVRCKECVIQKICRFAPFLGNEGYCSQGERKEEKE